MVKEQKYQTGYIQLGAGELNADVFQILEKCKEQSGRLIVGLPTDDLILKVTDKMPKHSYERVSRIFRSFRLIDEVIPVDIDGVNKRISYEQIGYDVYFYGTEYGRQFREDRKFFEEHHVAMVSVQPETNRRSDTVDSIFTALSNAVNDRKIVLFGTGKYFDYYMMQYGKKFPPAYAVDNSSVCWGTRKNGVTIKNPEVLREEEESTVIVILCCREYQEILEQISKYGLFDYRPIRCCDESAIMDEYAVIIQEEHTYLKKSHEILMKLMREFDRVCTKYNLKYYVTNGTLIGVVRHHGMIPWDDDIDIAMMRDDYEILQEKANEIWDGAEFLFLRYDQLGNGAFLDFAPRLIYMGEEIPTRSFKKVAGKARDDIQNRGMLEIIVLDNADVNGKRHKCVTTLIKAVYALAMGHRAYIDYAEYTAILSRGACFCLKIANCIGRILPAKFIFSLFRRLSRYAVNKDSDFCFEPENTRFSQMPRRYEKKLYGEGLRLKMLDIDVMVPAEYDQIMRVRYGDYMKFPPANGRKPTHYIKAKGVQY